MKSILDILRHHAQSDAHPDEFQKFHHELLDALKDGKLTEDEIRNLEMHRESLGISEKDLEAVRMQAYLLAFSYAAGDQDVTEDELDELEQIQDYLGLADSDIARTKKELYRMRILSEIKKGNMPVIETQDVVLGPAEIAHWSEPAIRESSSGKKSGTQKGVLIITNKRLVFRGPETSVAVPLSGVIDVDYAVNGLTVHLNGKRPLRILYREQGNHNVVASVLASAIDLHRVR